MATSDERNPQTVERCRDATLPKEVVDPPILIPAEKACNFSAFNAEFFKRWLERGMQGHTKILSWVVLLSLGIAQPNRVSGEVHIGQGERAFAEPATGVQTNLESYSHPLGFIDDSPPDYLDLVVGQFGFYPLSRSTDSELCQWVRLRKPAPDRFVEQLRQEFEFKQRRIMTDFTVVNRGSLPPAQVRFPVSVSDLAGVNDFVSFQERFNRLPRHAVTPSGVAFVSPVGSEIGRHPGNESRGTIRGRDLALFNANLFRQPLRLARFRRVGITEAGTGLLPFSRIKISPDQKPEGRPFVLPKVSHRGRVAYGRLKEKWNNVVSMVGYVAEMGRNGARIPTITPRGNGFPSWKRFCRLNSRVNRSKIHGYALYRGGLA